MAGGMSVGGSGPIGGLHTLSHHGSAMIKNTLATGNIYSIAPAPNDSSSSTKIISN
jgi:hypothetical protein